jgi:hypothetical protein
VAQVGVGSRVHSLHRYLPFPGSDTIAEPNYARALWRCVQCRNCGFLTPSARPAAIAPASPKRLADGVDQGHLEK